MRRVSSPSGYIVLGLGDQFECYDEPGLGIGLRSDWKISLVRWSTSPPLLFSVALVVRFLSIHKNSLYLVNFRDHLDFGFEVGRIARSLVQGQGFSSPFIGPSGPTAWLGPVYPLLAAGVFKLFGIYTPGSAVVILALNSMFAALTCLCIVAIGRETFGPKTGWWAAWIYALLPFEIAWATHWVWDTTLSALLLTVAFLLTLRLARGTAEARLWLAYGAVWGVIILTNGSLLSFLPLAAAWLALKLPSFRMRLAGSLLLACIIASPWWIRNWHTLHAFVPMRSNFGMELYLGNHEGARGYIMGWDHPVWNDEEMEHYRTVGEIAYVREKGEISREWIVAHPGEFVRLSLKRALIFWAGVPQRERLGPFYNVRIRHSIYFTASALAIWGAFLAWRRGIPGAQLFVGLFALYPLVYYITHTHARYRAPMEPLMMLSGVALVVAAFSRGSDRDRAFPASDATVTSEESAGSTRTRRFQRRNSPPAAVRTPK
jgi:4-amino-4-deoxy-L-arabinose transferase-like glycosyltransferase